jgi:hypothetical protein
MLFAITIYVIEMQRTNIVKSALLALSTIMRDGKQSKSFDITIIFFLMTVLAANTESIMSRLVLEKISAGEIAITC